MENLFLNQQFAFTHFLGPWLVAFGGVALTGGIVEAVIDWLNKKVILVKIVNDD